MLENGMWKVESKLGFCFWIEIRFSNFFATKFIKKNKLKWLLKNKEIHRFFLLKQSVMISSHKNFLILNFYLKNSVVESIDFYFFLSTFPTFCFNDKNV